MKRMCQFGLVQGKKILIILEKDLGLFQSIDKDIHAIRTSGTGLNAYYLTHDFAEPWKICNDKDDMTVAYVVSKDPISFTKNKDTYGLTPMNFTPLGKNAVREILDPRLFLDDEKVM